MRWNTPRAVAREGLEEGIWIGQPRAQRASLLDCLDAIERPVPRRVTDRIEAETDLTTLRSWFHVALKCRNLAEVEAVISAS